EFPELRRLHELYGARGLRVLAVSIDQGADPGVAAFAREHAATFTIGRDPEGRVQDAFQTIGVPETFLIAADGTLLWRRVGELRRNDAELAAALERVLRE
ncbi:MAG TPA: TlpA disulfide reductase family protein, partial [Gemmatimonadaceae bacterium]|nr:TlpA disulfide reductase family protein [Gemmatimonadaceae bacterium]